MKSKFKKGLTYLAATAFLFALAINVKVTLDDPFAFMSNEAFATGGGSSGGTGGRTDLWNLDSYIETGGQCYYCYYIEGQGFGVAQTCSCQDTLQYV